MFDAAATRVSGADQSLIAVSINDVNLVNPDSAVFVARLQETLRINITWRMLYDSEQYEEGYMRLSLHNNRSILQESEVYMDNGEKNSRVWSCNILPRDWALINYREYGRIEIDLVLHTSAGTLRDTTSIVLAVFPDDSIPTGSQEAWPSVVFVVAAIAGVVVTLACVKRVRCRFLSKHHFTVNVP